ncbi:phospholipase [Yersinia proxima]|uniref:phospholipase n=1 Tax=Yersinia proxima TaxID=2890316 RepID=UPI001D120EAC|nr:phospholipase [Yersinia proxima]
MSVSVSLARPVLSAGLMSQIKPMEQVKKESSIPAGPTDKLQREPTSLIPPQAGNDLYYSMLANLDVSHGERVLAASGNIPISSGQGSQQADYSLALLAKDVYAPAAGSIGGFTRLSDAALLSAGIDPASLSDTASGFQAGIYSDNQQYVLSFAGTNDIQDWLSNIRQATGYEDIQYNQAVALGKTAKMAFGDALVITGHSLGGGLAATAALASGTFAVTFNAAGVSDYTLNRLGMNPAQARQSAESGGIRRYSEQHDLLTDTQESTSLIPDAIGHKITLANSDKLAGVNDWLPHKHLERSLAAHGIDKVLSSMNEQQPWERQYA